MADVPDLIPSRAALKQNAILSGLGSAMIAEVLKTAKLVALKTSEQIYEAGRPIRDVYFPIDAVLSEEASCECYGVAREQFGALLQ